MGDTMDKVFETAGKLAGDAIRVTGDIVNKGYDKAGKMALQNRLAKLHRQLGALVYTLSKNGEENQPMINWYIAEIDRIKAKMNGQETTEEPDVHVYNGDDDSAGEYKDAMFCDGSGDEFP